MIELGLATISKFLTYQQLKHVFTKIKCSYHICKNTRETKASSYLVNQEDQRKNFIFDKLTAMGESRIPIDLSTSETKASLFESDEKEDIDININRYQDSTPIELSQEDIDSLHSQLLGYDEELHSNDNNFRFLQRKTFRKSLKLSSFTYTPEIKDEFIQISTKKEASLSIVSYNILSQIYMKKPNRRDLSQENRMKIIISELKNINADIICIQEADLNVYNRYFINNFPEYSLLYGVNCGSSFVNIIGYKKDRLKFISFKNFSLLDLGPAAGNRGMMNLIGESPITGDLISVYNVHLPWKFESDRVKMMMMILNHMREKKIKNVLFVGDFNSEPDSTPIKMIYYDYLFTNITWKFLPLRCEFLKLCEDVYHEFKLKSVYQNYKKLDHKNSKNKIKKKNINKNKKRLNGFLNHPKFTARTQYYKKNIDYIFYSCSMQPVKLLKIPVERDVEMEGYLPSAKYPSDHLKIYAEFNY